MNEITTTVTGQLAHDVELRYTATGDAVANFTVAATRRAFDKSAGQWQDADTVWMRCTLWRQAAENLAESLRKGDRVIVTGRLRQRSSRPRRVTSAPWSSWTPTRLARRCSSGRSPSTAPAPAQRGSPSWWAPARTTSRPSNPSACPPP